VAELPQQVLHVSPSTDVAAAAPVAETAAAPQRVALRERVYWPWISGALGLAWAATLALWWRSRAVERRPPAAVTAAPGDPKPALRKILRDLNSACAVGDAAAARNALLHFAEVRFAASPPRSLGALAALLPDGVAREVLELEAHIYGATAGAWRSDGLKAVLGELESAGTAPERSASEPLLPLYR
jgi:hypothetical protein